MITISYDYGGRKISATFQNSELSEMLDYLLDSQLSGSETVALRTSSGKSFKGTCEEVGDAILHALTVAI